MIVHEPLHTYVGTCESAWIIAHASQAQRQCLKSVYSAAYKAGTHVKAWIIAYITTAESRNKAWIMAHSVGTLDNAWILAYSVGTHAYAWCIL